MGSERRVALVLLTAGVTTLAPGTVNRAPGGDEPHTVRTLGDVGQYAVPAAGVVVAIAHKDRRGLGQLALSSAVSLGIVHTLKPLVDRQRPNGGGGSFPSGHTAFAFTGATFLHRRYGWAYGLPAYAVSAFVGYSRVHADEHWTSDVLAGAAIGVGASLIFTRPYRGVNVTAVAANGRPGFSITLSW